MIEKMKFLSMTGPKADIDRVVNQYLAKYEIHLENAMAQLSQVQNLSPYIQINPYKELLGQAEEFAGLLEQTDKIPLRNLSLEEAAALIDRLGSQMAELNAEREELNTQRKAIESLRNYHIKIEKPWKIMDRKEREYTEELLRWEKLKLMKIKEETRKAAMEKNGEKINIKDF